MRSAAALTVLVGAVLAGCGGSDEPSSAPSSQTLEQLWRAPGDDVAVVAGTATHVPGKVRFSFLVVDAEGRVVTLPTAKVWVARSLDAVPFLESEAELERIGVPGGAQADATHIYVARARLPRPGTYWFLAEPEGGDEPVQALGNVVVAAEDPVPDVGERAPASQTPTLASAGDASKITTRTPPDESLLRVSVAEALRRHAPFVVTFATPKYCTSRTCGPVVDVVEEVARRFEGRDVAFIHVEVYERNDPAKGYNRWMREWGLTTEPWTFVVQQDGRIAERFEGVVSVRELEAAVEAVADG
jgi:hypothetical protein